MAASYFPGQYFWEGDLVQQLSLPFGITGWQSNKQTVHEYTCTVTGSRFEKSLLFTITKTNKNMWKTPRKSLSTPELYGLVMLVFLSLLSCVSFCPKTTLQNL